MAFIDLGPIDELLNDPLKRRLVLLAVALIGLAIALAILRGIARSFRFLGTVIRWFSRPERESPSEDDLVIDLAKLPLAEPGATRLSVYHVPVRLAVVVIAPLGRESVRPTHSDVPKLLDQIVPGLGSVPAHDQTVVRIWPRQLSATGFAPSLMRYLRMPADKGRGTPWCLVAGRTTFDDSGYAVGLALAAAGMNKLDLIAVESEHQWMDVLRMRTE